MFGQTERVFAVWILPPACKEILPRRNDRLAIALRFLRLRGIPLLTSGLQVSSQPREPATGQIDGFDGEFLSLGNDRGSVAERVPLHLADGFTRVGRPLA